MKVCQIADHSRAGLTEFCINKNCSKQRLFCHHCFLQRHIQHPTDVIHLDPVSKSSRIQSLAKNCIYSQEQMKSFTHSIQILRKQTKEKKNQIKSMLKFFEDLIEKNIQTPLKTFHQSFSSGAVQQTVRKIFQQKGKKNQNLEIIAQQILYMEKQPKRTSAQMQRKVQALAKHILIDMNQAIKTLQQHFNTFLDKIILDIQQIQGGRQEEKPQDLQRVIQQSRIKYQAEQNNNKQLYNKCKIEEQYMEDNLNAQEMRTKFEYRTQNLMKFAGINGLKSPEKQQYNFKNPISGDLFSPIKLQAEQNYFKQIQNNKCKIEQQQVENELNEQQMYRNFYPMQAQNERLQQIQRNQGPLKIDETQLATKPKHIQNPDENLILLSEYSQSQEQNNDKELINSPQNLQLKLKNEIKVRKNNQNSQKNIKKQQKKQKQQKAVLVAMKDWGRFIKLAKNQEMGIQEWFQKKKTLGYLKQISIPNPKRIKDIEIPLQMTYIRNLECLELVNCNIQQIQHLAKCLRLKRLNLSHNSIKKIENLEKLQNLQSLIFCQNVISNIQGLQNNTKLKYVNLNYNQLKKIDNIKHLKQLNSLVLSNNEIQSIEDQFVFPDLDQFIKLQVYIDSNPVRKSFIQKTLKEQRIYLYFHSNYKCKCLGQMLI